MKISISFPPLESKKGTPLLTQNRQFQWFKDPTFIYPVIPAYAATLLNKNGFDIVWDDGIAEGLSYNEWLLRLKNEKPDVVAIETKTPVVKRHWKIISDIKKFYNPVVVLMGDHVTALPEESLLNSEADFIITGGDYDFSLYGLCSYLNLSKLSASESLKTPGIYYRNDGQIANTGRFELNNGLNGLPCIDRNLTKWHLYAYKNGNFKYTPGTYVMAGRDCWYGRCNFCSWTTLFPGKSFRSISPERHLNEIGMLIEELKVKEIFDDSGCFPVGDWLRDFAQGMIERGYNKKVVMGCNMRVGALKQEDWGLLKKANFRFILIGLESMTQTTLDKLNKGIKVSDIEETVKMAKKAGLEPHITAMVGYPWETKEEALKTIDFAKYLFQKGYLDTLQATIVVPYPGTTLFEEAKKEGWLLTEDWDRYDMKGSVWKSPVDNNDVLRFTQGLYTAALNPSFIARKVISIRNIDDLKFMLRAGRKVAAHLIDFGNKQKNNYQ
ncbi:MAG: B12-binding domain-containing radical SAM protein [Deltaproteobacteria bacterium]|nr:B12-binding domain-containing radical SAM protein [Deltaproteobacteria bacterium]